MGSEVAAGKAFLRKTNADGVSVYSHITEVLATLLAQKPENALDVLEGVSLACKQKHYSAAATVVPETPPEVPVAPSSVEASASAWHAANVSLLTPPGTVEEPVDYGEAVVKDVLAERALFEWCAHTAAVQSHQRRSHTGHAGVGGGSGTVLLQHSAQSR